MYWLTSKCAIKRQLIPKNRCKSLMLNLQELCHHFVIVKNYFSISLSLHLIYPASILVTHRSSSDWKRYMSEWLDVTDGWGAKQKTTQLIDWVMPTVCTVVNRPSSFTVKLCAVLTPTAKMSILSARLGALCCRRDATTTRGDSRSKQRESIRD